MKTLTYMGPSSQVNVAGVGKVCAGKSFEVEDARAEELLKKTVQQFQEAAPDYSAMTVAQLKDVLSSRGIAFDATAKKADLAALLEKGEAEE